ncbi:hypothetical protein DFH07DRAFT_737622 [Mycena maculata]|uniref:Uncharacterized protein n=1 Tax=Mycena maculata TaxID=230809 RepID=A0AAD7NLT6_9AGAR|nr:hypothetical protein DFH07DRAFT_737622 [Mycena maculata]
MKGILLTTAFVALVVSWARLADSNADCEVQAWARAEDLHPDHVSHGGLDRKKNIATNELYDKVRQAHCADRIASVTLRLRLDESITRHVYGHIITPQ